MGNKNDRVDVRKLAELLRSGLLSRVYHGENGVRTLRELARSYLALTRENVPSSRWPSAGSTPTTITI